MHAAAEQAHIHIEWEYPQVQGFGTLVRAIIKTIATKWLELLTQRVSVGLIPEDRSFKQNRCLIAQLIHAVKYSREPCFGKEFWILTNSYNS